MLSIQSTWVAKILNGEKTREFRGWIPKGFVGWVYLYCTKAKPKLYRLPTNNKKEWYLANKLPDGWVVNSNSFNGKVVARFWYDEYEEFNSSLGNPRLYIAGCVQDEEICQMFRGGMAYAWSIKKLEIFDNPKEINEFYHYKLKLIDCGIDCPPYYDEVKVQMTKAPQSWCYCEERK